MEGGRAHLQLLGSPLAFANRLTLLRLALPSLPALPCSRGYLAQLWEVQLAQGFVEADGYSVGEVQAAARFLHR